MLFISLCTEYEQRPPTCGDVTGFVVSYGIYQMRMFANPRKQTQNSESDLFLAFTKRFSCYSGLFMCFAVLCSESVETQSLRRHAIGTFIMVSSQPNVIRAINQEA